MRRAAFHPEESNRLKYNQQAVQAVENDLLAGAAVTVSERRLALRRLPLVLRKHIDELNNEATGG
ncbi:MAG: hypothetical protein ACQESR_10750 [Planctomycetota bacterium]